MSTLRLCALALGFLLCGCSSNGESPSAASGTGGGSSGNGSSGSSSGSGTGGALSGSSLPAGSGGGAGDTSGSVSSAGAASGSSSVPMMDGGDAMDGTSALTGKDASNDGPGGALDATVVAMMRKVTDWQLAQGGTNAIDWIHGAMWTGIMATYQTTGDKKYLDAVTAWGTANKWSLAGGITTNADNQCAAQTYFDAYLLNPGPASMNLVTGAKPSFDAMVASGNAGWTWEDALFMSPPGLTRLGVIQNDPKYFQLLDTNWAKTYASLFAVADGLSCRDPNCNGVYWGRGVGWVIAGLARVLEYLPANEPKHDGYVAQLKTMAAALKPWQATDGLWRSDITHPMRFPNPETSGSGFMTFAIAWGVNAGILDRATYLPVAQKGWQGLVTCVDGATGKLGCVQAVGAAPGPAAAGSSAPYGTGAFLLAGSQVARLGL